MQKGTALSLQNRLGCPDLLHGEISPLCLIRIVRVPVRPSSLIEHEASEVHHVKTNVWLHV